MERSRSPRVIIIFILAVIAAWYYVSWLGPKYHQEADDINDTIPRYVISTIPKSGTLYLINILFAYDAALSGESDASIEARYVANSLSAYKTRYPNIPFPSFAVAHAMAPTYAATAQADPLYETWQSTPHTVSSDWGSTLDEIKTFDFTHKRTDKTVLLYREPTSQIASYFPHMVNHKLPEEKRLTMDGETLDERMEHFVFDHHILDSYLKVWHSYQYLQSQFPEQVKIVRYETLIAQPEDTLREILAFFGHTITDEAAFQRALQFASKDNMIRLEAQSGPMAQDQASSDERHIRGGVDPHYTGQLPEALTKKIREAIAASPFSTPELLPAS